MSGKVCTCGELLSDVIFPNDLEWNIYYENEFKNWINYKYFEYIQGQEDFDYFWLCPKCKCCHVWLNKNRKYSEFRLYEYKEILNNENINISDMKELFVISANDEESFNEDIIIRDIMHLFLHEHRYFITNQKNIVYLYNVNTNEIDGKYIITYSTTNKYDISMNEEERLEIIKIFDGTEKYFDEKGNEIKRIE